MKDWFMTLAKEDLNFARQWTLNQIGLNDGVLNWMSNPTFTESNGNMFTLCRPCGAWLHC